MPDGFNGIEVLVLGALAVASCTMGFCTREQPKEPKAVIGVTFKDEADALTLREHGVLPVEPIREALNTALNNYRTGKSGLIVLDLKALAPAPGK